jgi:hypothetical protein
MYFENIAGGAMQPVYGVTGTFKVNTCLSATKKRRGMQPIHAGTAKIDTVELYAAFVAIHTATRMDAGEFVYLSRNQMLKLETVTAATGLTYPGVDIYAIPIEFISRDSDEATVTSIQRNPERL